MLEIALFLSPVLYDANLHFIESLKENEIEVNRLDATNESYQDAVQKHLEKLDREVGQDLTSSVLCIAIEDTKVGIQKAASAGMTVLAVGQNPIEIHDFATKYGAHASAASVNELLENFSIQEYYQIQYIPYVIHLKQTAKQKVGYPVSLLDTLNTRSHTRRGSFSIDHVSGTRMVSRQVLGIEPNSLADLYINNVGMPSDRVKTLLLDTHELERDIIRMFARLYNVEEKHMSGFVTTGGTEGNFCGLWWQRDNLKHLSGGEAPILLTSNQTHYSVSKAAQQLGLEGRLVETNSDGEMDLEDLSRILDEIASKEPNRPVLMNVNFGTTQTGAIDNLPGIDKLLVDKVKSREIPYSIHLDAALLGGIIPIIKPFGDNINIFQDFNVKTMAISGHKFFGSNAICGICLTPAAFLDECFSTKKTDVGYLNGVHDMTPSGSRSGFNVLSLHNTLCGLGMQTKSARTLKQITTKCYQNADYFTERITNIVGKDNVIRANGSLNVCFSPRPSPAMMEEFCLMPVKMPNDKNDNREYAGVCVLANIDKALIDRFLEAYEFDINLKDSVKRMHLAYSLRQSSIRAEADVHQMRNSTCSVAEAA